MNRIIRVGHSPDADDAFMFYALAKGKIHPNGFLLKHVIKDIQTLNKLALKNKLEVTAVSAALYPAISDRYWILSSGASVGRNYGPILVSNNPMLKKNLKGKRIAVPGKQTTAYLLLKIFLEDFIPIEIRFDEIIPAVRQGKADAGLVIHEGQIQYKSLGMRKVLDLGEMWFEKYGLPIPLGLDVVRKDIGRNAAQEINSVLRKSIEYARKNIAPAIRYARKFGRGIPEKSAWKFVDMYVNNDTIQLPDDCKRALNKLYDLGFKMGMHTSLPKIEVIS